MMIRGIDKMLLDELNNEITRLSREYAKLKNKPKPFQAERDEDEEAEQLKNYRREKEKMFDSLPDIEKKKDYILELRKEVEDLKVRTRRDELEQKLIDQDQDITEKELLELLTLNNILLRKETT
jgi:hypothetical protein